MEPLRRKARRVRATILPEVVFRQVGQYKARAVPRRHHFGLADHPAERLQLFWV
ncbi:MAG: hypothetical protein M5U12_00225 [Verrucomicrobia bacterium]|nr:hypothetical protein [Verrucomicrobiota bacterium]